MRPKYLLTDYLGRGMIEPVAQQYLQKHRVHIVILKQHDEQHGSSMHLRNMLGDAVNIIVLPEPTSGPAETICQALAQIRTGDTFLVRDCDSRFDHEPLASGNRLFVDCLANHPDIRMPANKSYVEVNNWGVVSNIMEKKIISDLFCVGGYQFADPAAFLAAYEDIKQSRLDEIFISSVIDHVISNGGIFSASRVSNYVDLGTIDEWERFNDKPTIFCDIDGTLIKNQAPYGPNNYETTVVPLQNNVNALLAAKARGCQIIFTTARRSQVHDITRKTLDDLGFADCQLIMDLHHARRMLINDWAPTNPYPSAVAVNLRRDDDCLDQMMDS
jgi:hypothetical protein